MYMYHAFASLPQTDALYKMHCTPLHYGGLARNRPGLTDILSFALQS